MREQAGERQVNKTGTEKGERSLKNTFQELPSEKPARKNASVSKKKNRGELPVSGAIHPIGKTFLSRNGWEGFGSPYMEWLAHKANCSKGSERGGK